MIITEEKKPEVEGNYDILVQMLYAGMNPVDWKACDWVGGPFNFQHPRRCGIDGCGKVVGVGKSVDKSQFIEGETIVYFHGSLEREHGTFAQYYVTDSRAVGIVKKSLLDAYKDEPNKLFASLASLPCALFTAYQAVVNKLALPVFEEHQTSFTRIRKNLVVTAAAGGVGGFCVQLLRLWRENQPNKDEINIIGTCSAKNSDYVKSLGATYTIDYKSTNIKEILMDKTKEDGVDVWIDCVSADSARAGLGSLAHGGELVIVVDNPDYTDRLFAKSITVHNVALGMVYYTGNPERISELGRIAKRAISLFEDKKITTQFREVAFENIKDGLAEVKSGHVQGKIVASCNADNARVTPRIPPELTTAQAFNVRFEVAPNDYGQGYLSKTFETSKFGLIMIQEWWGLNQSIAETADLYAAKGFRTLIPDVYRGKIATSHEAAGHLLSGLDWKQALKDIKGAIKFLKEKGCISVGIVGFCMGGALAIAAMTEMPEIDAGTCFYGVPDLKEYDLNKLTKPIICYFGELDTATGFSDKKTAEMLAEKAEGLKKDLIVNIIPKAGHAFMNRARVDTYMPELAAKILEENTAWLAKKLMI